MWKTLLVSFQQALANSWANLFHTFLSILGIVIGVAALVAILSLIDGMEEYANEQIASTTSLQGITVRPKAYDTIDGVRVARPERPRFTYNDYAFLRTRLDTSHHILMTVGRSHRYQLANDTTTRAAHFRGLTLFQYGEPTEMAHGRVLTAADLDQRRPVAMINTILADSLHTVGGPESLLGQVIHYDSTALEIVGVTAPREGERQTEVYYPLSVLPASAFAERNPSLVVFAASAEAVQPVKEKIGRLLTERFPDQKADAFDLVTDEFRLDQVAQGFLVFRLVMGLIVGIAVLVGGIGVMNVLLISVTERTREIGLRKAMGAKKSDIVLQFLAEAVTVSSLGAVLGLLLGVLGALGIAPIITMLTEAPFGVAFTVNTLIVVAVIAILIGIVFGTYPALRAARMDPVEAIRRE